MPEFHRTVREGDCERLVDSNLSRVYEMHLADKMPDRFRALLEQLRQCEKAA